tara:strand:- start:6999 stop:8795 length:1797 start_codon:yes stop_codon:yes gene_type:complete
MATKKTPIKYTSRDFSTIKQDLINYAKRNYSETYKDFNESSFGALMLDTVSYVGDILSFYLDYQVNESFLDTAVEYQNVKRLSRQYGFKYTGAPSATGVADFYITLPANSTGMGPNLSYAPILKAGSQFSTNGGAPYLLIDSLQFDNPNNEVVVAKVNNSTGIPVSYAIRARGRVISGKIMQESFTVTDYQRFRRLFLSLPRVAEVITVFDSDGNEYYNVENLSQDVIYKDVVNKNNTGDTVSTLLRPFSVPRRFTVEKDGPLTYLQFGYGSEDEAVAEASVAEPSSVVLQMNGKPYISSLNFDPSKLLETDKFGVAPVNTTLTVKYRVNMVNNVNAPIGTLVTVNKANFSYRNVRQLDAALMSQVNNSIEVYNGEPIIGDVMEPTSEELRIRTLDSFATQNRAVTQKDYEAMVYAMPTKYGAIKRCKITRDPDSFKRNLNLYILSENADGTLTTANATLKQNLKTWLNSVKMINDTIDIIDGRIINLAIDFKVVADTDRNKYDVLDACINALKTKFSQPLLLGESFYITDIYNTLNDVLGVVDTESVHVKIRNGLSYSDTRFNLNDQKSADGRYINAPDNVSFEIKYPGKDIKGTVR